MKFAPPDKLLLIAKNDASTFKVTSLKLPDKNDNFQVPLEQYTTIPFAPNEDNASTLTPSVTWDSNNRVVLIAIRRGDGSIGLLNLRSGRIIGERSWVSTGEKDDSASNDPPSIIFYRGAPLIAFRQASDSGIVASCKAETWPKDGKWNVQGLLGPLGQQIQSSNPPCLCLVGIEWIYVFWFDDSGNNLVHYLVIDNHGLKNSWDGPSSRRRVAWNPYSTPFGNVKDGGFVGMPSVVCIGLSVCKALANSFTGSHNSCRIFTNNSTHPRLWNYHDQPAPLPNYPLATERPALSRRV